MSATTEKQEIDISAIAGEDGIDAEAFGQILEMDEPGDHEFSESIVSGFFEQARETFKDMDSALESKDLPKLSSLGHFLKGSSATLGLEYIRDGCEKIQRYGSREAPDGTPQLDNELCLKLIEEVLVAVRKDFRMARTILAKYYDLPDDQEEVDEE